MVARWNEQIMAGAPEERLQAMAGQLVGLIRDKNATIETALAGLDQLGARMRALEQMGDEVDARAVARRLIRMSPSSPHAAQARALLERAGEKP